MCGDLLEEEEQIADEFRPLKPVVNPAQHWVNQGGQHSSQKSPCRGVKE